MKKRVKTLAAVICMTALLIPVWQTTELKAAKQDKVTVFAKKKTKKSKKSKKKITYKGIVNITGKNFEKARQHGPFADVDFLASNFTAHRLQLTIHNEDKLDKHKNIYVGWDLKKKLLDYTNQGRKYQ